MEWTMITDGRLKAYAYDEKGHDWSISFDGYDDCEAPLGGDGVVLTRNDERVAAVSVEYYGADAEAAGYDMDALIAKVVEAVKSIAEALAGEVSSLVEFTTVESHGWVYGRIGDYRFSAKICDEPSGFGLPTARFPEGGTVVKLSITDYRSIEVYRFERGFAVASIPQEIPVEILAAIEAKFCKAGE